MSIREGLDGEKPCRQISHCSAVAAHLGGVVQPRRHLELRCHDSCESDNETGLVS